MSIEETNSVDLNQRALLEKEDNLQDLNDLKRSSEGVRSGVSLSTNQADKKYENDDVFESVNDVDLEPKSFVERSGFTCGRSYVEPRNKAVEQQSSEKKYKFQFGYLNAEQAQLGQKHAKEDFLQDLSDLKRSSEGVRSGASLSPTQTDEQYDNGEVFCVQDIYLGPKSFADSSGSRYRIPKHTKEGAEGRGQSCAQKSSKKKLYDVEECLSSSRKVKYPSKRRMFDVGVKGLDGSLYTPLQYLELERQNTASKDFAFDGSQNNRPEKFASTRECLRQCSAITHSSREKRRNYSRSPQRPPSDQNKNKQKPLVNLSRREVLKDVKENKKGPGNETSDSIFQIDESNVKKCAIKRKGDESSRQYRGRDSSNERKRRRSYFRTQQRQKDEPSDYFYKLYRERKRHHDYYNSNRYEYSRPDYPERRYRSPYEKFRYSRNERTIENVREDERYRYRSPIHSLRRTYYRRLSTPRKQNRREEHMDVSKGYEYKNNLRKKRAGDYIENNYEGNKIRCRSYQGEPRVKERRF